MQKADSIPSVGTKADSEQKDENLFVSSHDTKPNVSGLPLSNPEKIVLNQKDVTRLNRYIIDMSAHLPDKVRASAKWQGQSSKVLHSLGIS